MVIIRSSPLGVQLPSVRCTAYLCLGWFAMLLPFAACTASGDKVQSYSGADEDGVTRLHVGKAKVLLPLWEVQPAAVLAIEPTLPDGLQFDAKTGIIEGVPTATAELEVYRIVGNAPPGGEKDGQQEAILRLEVLDGAFLLRAAGARRVLIGGYAEGLTSSVGGPGHELNLIGPSNLYIHKGHLFIAQYSCILMLDLQTNMVEVFIGKPGVDGNEGDGSTRDKALLNRPWGMVVIADELYFSDSAAHVVRKVGLAPNSLVARVAGTGKEGLPTSETEVEQALTSPLAYPVSLAAYDDDDSQLFVTDSNNHCIRSIELQSGLIRTVIGTCGSRGLGQDDTEPALESLLSFPHDIYCLGHRLIVADWGNRRIRSMDRGTSQVTTIAGSLLSSDEDPIVNLTSIGPVMLTGSDDKRILYISATRQHSILQLHVEQALRAPGKMLEQQKIAGIGRADDGNDNGDLDDSGFFPLHTPRGLAVHGEELLVAEWHMVRALPLSPSVAARAPPPAGQPAPGDSRGRKPISKYQEL